MKKQIQSGFTLLEVMVVVVIIAIMAAAVVPNVMAQLDEAKINTVKADIKSIESALQLYKLQNFNYPSTDQGIEALVNKPSGSPEAKNWKAAYVKVLPRDPWGNAYQYVTPGTEGDFDLYSWGPDGKESDDDIGNWAEKAE